MVQKAFLWAVMFICIKQALGLLVTEGTDQEAKIKTLQNKVVNFPEAKSKFITMKRNSI